MKNLYKILFPYSFWKGSVVLWAVLTAVYLCFNFIWGETMLPKSVLNALFGLFVPYGVWNSFLSLEAPFPIARFLLILFPFAILSLDAFLARCKIAYPKHIPFTLLFLLAWTLLVDFLIYGDYMSFNYLLEAFGYDMDLEIR